MPPSLMQHRVENHNYLKYYLLKARRAGISSAGAVRPRNTIEKTQKARRVDTTLWVDEHL
jgi:hypothetical protein